MKRPVVIGISVLVAVIVTGLILFSRTGSPRTAQTGGKDPRASDDSPLESARELLQKAGSAHIYRNAVHQLNAYLDRNPEQRPKPLAHPELVRKQLGLDADELAEVNSISFTLLDAHHLDLCLLLRDAARSLEVEDRPPLERAKAAFAWVVRQVRLQELERTEPMLPPQFVLRRGWGTSQERAVVFLELLQRMGIPGCMTVIPGDEQSGRYIYWIPGALINKEVYLFDTRLGLPLPGPDGQEIGTLRQVRTSANPFRVLAIDENHHYDLTVDQAKRAEIHLVCTLSEAAPRMKYLESLFSQPKKISLAVDATKLAEEFREATRGQDIPIHFWGELGEAGAPIRVLRNYLPPEEGGADKTGRVIQSKLTLLPRASIPVPRFVLERDRQFGEQIAYAFALPFGDFFLSPSPGAGLRSSAGHRFSMWRPGVYGGSDSGSGNSRTTFTAGESARAIGATMGPRELVLRGAFNEASTLLVSAPVTVHFRETLLQILGQPFADIALEEEKEWVQKGAQRFSLETLKEMAPDVPVDLEQRVAQWCDQAVDARAELFQAQEAFQAGKISEDKLEANWKKTIQLWKEGDKLLSAQFFKTISYPLGAEVTYQLALCKQERAIRLQAQLQKLGPSQAEEEQARAAWKQAAHWWGKYEIEYGSAVAIATARLRLSEALTNLGDYPAALSQLENLSRGITNLEETARLYQAQLLRKRTAKK